MGYSHSRKVFQHQPDAYIDQANPVSGQKYEWSSDGTQTNKLGTIKNVRIIGIVAQCTWTVEPGEIRIYVTIDGQDMFSFQGAPVSEKDYYWGLSMTQTGNYLCRDASSGRAFLFEGRSMKVEVSVTNGTVSNLSARVKYAKIP